MVPLIRIEISYGAYKKGGKKKRRLGYTFKITLQYID